MSNDSKHTLYNYLAKKQFVKNEKEDIFLLLVR